MFNSIKNAFDNTVKFVKDTAEVVRAETKYTCIYMKTYAELSMGQAGKEADVPLTTQSGIEIIDATAVFGATPDARSYGSKLPDDCFLLDAEGNKILLNGRILLNRQLASCKKLLPAVLAHEEGHVLHDVFVDTGYSMEKAELIADQYMIESCTEEEVMYFLAMISIYNSSMRKTGQIEAYEVNKKRIRILREYLGLRVKK